VAKLRQIASLVRSKNAGPFELTIDIMFDNGATYDRVVRSSVLSPELIAATYGIAADDVRVMPYAPANAIKITFPRPVTSGDLEDSDGLGGQQYAPLVDVEVPD
jgi:hypothetical protein